MARPTKTDDELREGSEHVLFECELMSAALVQWRSLARSPIENNPMGLRQAWLVAFCVSARNLYAFLYETPRKDDLSAVDFVPDWEVSALPEAPDVEPIHKRVAHLTWAREHNAPWPYEAIAHRLEQALAVFMHRVDRARLSEKWSVHMAGRVKEVRVDRARMLPTANTVLEPAYVMQVRRPTVKPGGSKP